jgi:hypothetical protein
MARGPEWLERRLSMIRILIGGDICPVGSIKSAFIKGNAAEIFNDLMEEIKSADLSIANLECPLISQSRPIRKAGPILGSSVECINGLSAAGWQVLNLANNHSFDHGAHGLKETIATIRGAGLSFVGAGLDIEEAQAPLIREIEGQRVIIYSMAEHEFSVADHNTPGANPLDLMDFINAVRKHKEHGFFIALIHGGMEDNPYPSPEMVKRCRFMVEMGADAVICCHAHCPQPWEFHSGRPIIYGLGNLVFELTGEPEAFHIGYLARLDVGGGQVHLNVIPYTQSQQRPGAHRMNGIEFVKFMTDMGTKNRNVLDEDFIREHWQRHCLQHRIDYLASLFGHFRAKRILRRFLIDRLFSKEAILQALHLVECETHQEVLKTIFEYEKRDTG